MSQDYPREPYNLDRESLERDSDMTFFTAGGPGGQHRNKVATGVRLVHRPSGTVVTATERRSQSANREMAFDRLAERLRVANAPPPPPRVATKPSRASVARKQESKQRRAAVKQARRPIRDE